MNKLILLSFSLILIHVSLHGQSNNRTISVTGYASKVVVPDQIFVSLSIQEFLEGEQKVDIRQLEDRLFSVIRQLNMEDKDIQLDNLTGYTNYAYDGKAEFLLSKTYSIVFRSLDALIQFSNRLGEMGVTTINVNNFGHSKLKDYLKDLKVQALENAEQEAEEILKITGKKLGELISLDLNQSSNESYLFSSYDNWATSSFSEIKDSGIRPVTLRYNLRAVYEIE